MNAILGLPDGVPGAGYGGGGGRGSSDGSTPCGSILTVSKDRETSHKNQNMSIEDSSPYPIDDDDDDDLALELGLSIGGGLKTKEEGSRILTTKEFPSLVSSCSSSSSSSSSYVNIPNSSIAGTKRTAIDSVSPPNGTSVVGWPPIRRSAQRMPILANRIKSEHHEFSKNISNAHHLSVKVNMDGTLIGRKVDLYAHTSYEMLAQTLENMFYGTRSSKGLESSRLLNGTSEFVLTYEDKDGDCMLVGDVPWQMFLSTVKRLRILRNALMQH